MHEYIYKYVYRYVCFICLKKYNKNCTSCALTKSGEIVPYSLKIHFTIRRFFCVCVYFCNDPYK